MRRWRDRMPGEWGHIHIISLVLLFLAIVGMLSLYKGYREEHLRESLLEALDEGKMLADDLITDQGQKATVSEAYQQARQAIAETPEIAEAAPVIRKVIANIRELAEQSHRGREEI